MSDFVSLFCLVYGDSFNSLFVVDIERERSVPALKELIIIKGPSSLKDLRAPDLDLWKVEIPITKAKVAQVPELKDENELSMLDKIAEHFDNPPQKCIHVIVLVKPGK